MYQRKITFTTDKMAFVLLYKCIKIKIINGCIFLPIEYKFIITKIRIYFSVPN